MTQPRYRRIFADMKRRKVFRVVTLYGATGFVVLQVVELLAEGMGFPPVVLQATTLVVVLGLPVAIVLAWALEVTDGGVRKTDDAAEGELEEIIAQPAASRWLSGLVALAAMAVLIGSAWWAGRSSAVSDSLTPASSAMEDTDAVLRMAYVDLSQDVRPAIAVLPFADMSQDQDQEYFADGMSEEIINALAKVRGIRVTGRTSSFAFKGENRNLRQIGAELGVRYLVEGSVRKQGERLRITALLVDTTDNFQVWSESYDRTLDDIFGIQAGIAESVVEQLQVSLELVPQGGLVTPTVSMKAYERYLLGRSRMRARGPGVAEAVQLFTEATALDGDWAPAWAGLAQAQSLAPYYYQQEGAPTADSSVWAGVWAESLDAAEVAARRALSLDPGSAEAVVALGNASRDRWSWIEAEQHYLHALTIDPDNAEAHQQYAELLAAIGRLDEALRSARRGVELDPSVIRRNVLGYIAHFNLRYDEALAALEAAVAAEPLFDSPYANLARVHLSLGDMESALQAFSHLLAPDELVLFERSFETGDGVGLETCCAEKFYVAGLQAMVGDESAAITSFRRRVLEGTPFGTDQLYGLWDREMDAIRLRPEMQPVLERAGLLGVKVKRDAPGG